MMVNSIYLPLLVFSPSLKTFNELFNSQRTEAEVFSIVSKAEEFEQLKVRGHHKLITGTTMIVRASVQP